MTWLAQRLLEVMRTHLHESGVGYAEWPTPISGGYDTQIFGFRLSGAADRFAAPLILRVLGSHHPPARALVERTIQNTVAGLGYPAPRVLLASADAAILGGPFLVMERLPGRPLLQARTLRAASVLVDMHLALHALDADVLLEALDREGQASRLAGGPSISRDRVTFEGHLAGLERRIARGRLRGLEPAMAWLLEHRPVSPHRTVICHGDFHPQNILASDERVTGVIDWPNTVVADPAFDVASTRVILDLVPTALLGVPPPLRGLVGVARRVLVFRYVRGYERRSSLGASRLAYHEALACMRGLVRTVAARLAAADGAGLNALDASVFGERLAARFAHLTGVTPVLPSAPVSPGARRA